MIDYFCEVSKLNQINATLTTSWNQMFIIFNFRFFKENEKWNDHLSWYWMQLAELHSDFFHSVNMNDIFICNYVIIYIFKYG